MQISKPYKANSGKSFAFALLLPGAVSEARPKFINHTGKTIVEIHDCDTGQFISDYSLVTLMHGRTRDCGINLCGYVPEWTIDATTWNQMLDDISKL